MNLTEKRVVVTGGAGLIGSHLADRLSGDNNVVVADDLSKGTRDSVPDGAFVLVCQRLTAINPSIRRSPDTRRIPRGSPISHRGRGSTAPPW